MACHDRVLALRALPFFRGERCVLRYLHLDLCGAQRKDRVLSGHRGRPFDPAMGGEGGAGFLEG